MGEPITEHHAHGVPTIIENVEPVPVHIVGTSVDDQESAPYASWQTIPLTGTEAAQQLLAQDVKRKRAQIFINPGFTNGNTLGYVLVGSRSQVQNGQGGVLVSGNVVNISNTRELWIATDGSHALTVTILDERYR